MRKHALFFWVLALAAATRFFILFHSQTHVHSDEAIIGLMGKHILAGWYHPFYMYGQDFNAGAAWEAYLAAASFAIFGVGVAPLKGCIVVLSLVCLGLFYRMACALYGLRLAALAALVFALSPSLLKWHFQVRGYSWCFLSLPVLTSVFLSLESPPAARPGKMFLFGLVSGLSVWCLELGLAFNAALWLLLGLRGKLSARNGLAAAAGFLAGYGPAILFNFTHHFSNWQYVFTAKTNEHILSILFGSGTLATIFLHDMPKFFGSDTVLWYYPETPALGLVLYFVALLAVAVALWPFLKTPAKIGAALRGQAAASAENRDFLMLALTAACFIPYLAAPTRVPGYFLGGCFFLSILMARLVERCLAVPAALPRLAGAALLLAILVCGVGALVETGSRNQIETLMLNRPYKDFHVTRVPGRDIEAVEKCLGQSQITSVWATPSFVYPLIFESDETRAVSGLISGWTPKVYQESVPRWELGGGQRMAFVIESDSPFRPTVEAKCAQATGEAPLVTDCGTLTVIEGKARPASTGTSPH
jgi:hypothetical protein